MPPKTKNPKSLNPCSPDTLNPQPLNHKHECPLVSPESSGLSGSRVWGLELRFRDQSLELQAIGSQSLGLEARL